MPERCEVPNAGVNCRRMPANLARKLVRIIAPVSSFYVENFGCRATQADGAAIERQLRERGLERAPQPEEAQVVVLNTCTVTASADQDVRATIRRIHRANPECKILVTGCYAHARPWSWRRCPACSG